MEFRKKLNYWITAALLILFGVLFIVVGTKTDNQKVISTLDTIFGVLFLIEGSALILVSILVKKQFVSSLSLAGALALSLGIYTLVESFINNILAVVLNFIPYFLIVVGSLMVFQALITYFLGKKKSLPLLIIQLVYGIIILTFGILGLTVFKDLDTKFIILGIIICIYATYIIVASFFPGALVIVVNKDEPEEAEVIETELNQPNDNE